MKTIFNLIIIIATITALITSCSEEKITPSNHNAIYYWKTIFEINPTEQNFLNQHKIDKLYLRLFDVVPGIDKTSNLNAIPNATISFASPIPQNVEIIPVVYITIEALRNFAGKEDIFASFIVERINAICNHNNFRKINEIQLDCDWTSSTKSIYELLCQSIKNALNNDSIQLSITIRLHQLNETPPPCNKGVLMLYNTGAIKNYDTKNSILDIDDVVPYIASYNGKYPVPLDYAYPTFGLGVRFYNKEFTNIVSEKSKPFTDKEHIRVERPSSEEILIVKNLIEHHIGKPTNTNIIYHLDSAQLINYTNNEIDKILAR